MGYEDELRILENMGKGRKARPLLPARSYSASKYQTYQKGRGNSHASSSRAPLIRKLSDMLQTAAGKRQAILKITSYGKGESKVFTHLRYISRNGKLELETQDGNKVKTLKEQRDLVDRWSLDFGTNKRSRDTLNLMLSTPPGTDRQAALGAAQDFLQDEFGNDGHEYVFVRHDDTEHPHVHAAIKMVSIYGKKLNPRKAYLRQARERFATRCRTYGIDVEASPRYERGLSGKSKRSEFVQMARYDRRPEVDKNLIQRIKEEHTKRETILKHPSETKTLKRNQIIRKRYAEKAKQVYKKAQSLTNPDQQVKYQKVAKLLDRHAKTMPVETNRGQKLHRQLDQKQGLTAQQLFTQPETIDSLNQYYAVTQGKSNEEGIFVSPVEEIAHSVVAALGELLEQEKTKDTEAEIDFED